MPLSDVLWMLLGIIVVSSLASAKDFDNPSLGVKFTHKGYFTAASSHYIHTIRIPTMMRFDDNGKYIPHLDYQYLNCRNDSSIIQNIDDDLVRAFCIQTQAWRNELIDLSWDFVREMISYDENLNITFPDRTAQILEQAQRPTRFLSILTGAASLISRVLDGYEKIVMARQIRHLSQNQEVLFTNQERIMRHMQSTQEHNKQMYARLANRVHRYKQKMDQMWQQVILNAQEASNNNKKVRLQQAIIKIMNYVYSVHMPAMSEITVELRRRTNAIQEISEGKLPISIVRPYQLREILTNAQDQLAVYDAQLAVTDIELLYTMRIVTAQRVGRDLYLSLMLPVTARDVPGTFELYQVDTYPIPTDHSPKTNMSTRMIHLPKYVAESNGKFIELHDGQLESCIRDAQMYQCPFDMPIIDDTCASAIFEDNHVEILRRCEFEINPVFEQEIVRELSPGRYLVSMHNTTWIKQCPNETVEIPSCLFCIIYLDCGCQLQAGQYHLMGTYDTCVDQTPSEITYVFNSAFHYFMAPNQYFEQEIWDAQTGLTWEPKAGFVVENADYDQVDTQWVDLKQDWSDMLEEGTLDMMPMITKTKYLDELYIGALIVAIIVTILTLAAISACLVYRSKASKLGNHFLKAGGALGFLPATHAAPVFEAPSYGSITGALILGLLAILILYISVWGIRWLINGAKRTIAPYAWATGNKIKTILVLELMTEDEFAIIPIAEYFISPEAFLVVYDPSKLGVTIEYSWWMTACRVNYGKHVAIYIDTAKSSMTLPQRVRIPWFWRKKIERMLDDLSLTARLTVIVNKINYKECVLPIEDGIRNHQQFKRAARERTSQKFSGVSTPLEPTAPPVTPMTSARLFTVSNEY